MRGYSLDLRERIVQAVNNEQEKVTSVAKRFGVSRWTVRRYLNRAATNKLSESAHPGQNSQLNKESEEKLKEQVKTHPDWTLEKHAEVLTKATGQSFRKSVIGKYFKRLGLSLKKEATVSP